MKIKNNIKLISLTPIILLFALSVYMIFTNYISFRQIEKSTQKIKQINKLDLLLTDLLKEREFAIKHILSNSNEAIFELNKRIKKTNDQVNNLVALYNLDKEDKLTYKIIEDVKNIVNIRQNIHQKTISYDKLFSYYDMANSDILNKISSLKALSKPSLAQTSNSYTKAINLKKSLADERDFIAKIFKKDADMDNLYIAKVLKDSNIYQTFLLLDNDIKKLLSDYLNTNDFFQLIQKSDKIKKEILHKGYSDEHTIQEWYKLEDEKSKKFTKATTLIKENSLKKASLEGEIAIAKIFLASLLALLSIFFLIKYFRIKDFLFDTNHLKLLLEKSQSKTINMPKKIDLETTSGVQEAYKMIDISLDKIELERQKATNENASKTIFLANMSHEIRTPINGIVGFTDLLKKSNLNKEQQEYIDIISKSTDNLLEIINNILDLSKIESKKVEIDSITFSPIEEFESTTELFIAKSAKKDINLSLFLDTGFENYLQGDALKVKEVLLNLISNAVKFTPKGGEINISIKKVKNQDPQKEKIYFEVTDNGIGMSQDELSEVFEAFTQADSTITRKYGGTGLGLTISSNYVALLGGKLEVYSKKDKGTTFFFTLEFTKLQPLKEIKYKKAFKEVEALVVSDKQNEQMAKYLSDYFNFFCKNTTYTDIASIGQNTSLFESANLIIVTKDIYQKNNFSHLEKTDKKLLVIEPTSSYLDKKDTTNNISKLIEPLSFYKVVEFLTSITPKSHLQLLPDIQKEQNSAKDSYNILVAEDNEINLRLIEKIFDNYTNINLTKATNGQEAVDTFMTRKFDLILMDIAMPVLDGISASKKIIEYEQINSLPHSPIIALTANALKGDKEKFLSAGMDEYVTKPLTQDQLLKVLKKFGIVAQENSQEPAPKPTQTPLTTVHDLPRKDILIFKKSQVETKIFQKVLAPLYKDVEIATNKDDFISKINTNSYSAILLDTELQDLTTEEISQIKEKTTKTAFILFRNFETKIEHKQRAIFDEIVINSADKSYLQMILENYIPKEN